VSEEGGESEEIEEGEDTEFQNGTTIALRQPANLPSNVQVFGGVDIVVLF
jgi:hypothetical protein